MGKRIWRFLIAVAFPILAIIVWEIAFRRELISTSQFTAPNKIASTLIDLFESGDLQKNARLSLSRLVVGSLIGVGLGALVGIWIGIASKLERPFGPTLGFFAGVPVVVWMPFWIAVAGTGEAFKTGLVAIAAFFLAYTVALISTKRASRKYLEVSLLFEKSNFQRVRHVYFPATLEQLFISLRIALALGWIILFFVEYAVAKDGSEGIGWFVAHSRNIGRIEDEFAGLVVVGISAFLIDRLVYFLQKILLAWSDTVEES